MGIPKDTLWELDPHTKAKHEILKGYLQAWFPILSKYNRRIVYIDGFCGPGRYKGGEPGSPVIALDVAINHRRTLAGEVAFWFIDERQDRIDHLKEELHQLAIPRHFRVSPECGIFHEKLEQVLNLIERDGAKLAPTFAFIDPFGFSGIPYSLVQRLLQHRKCETFITFMVDAINRFIEHPQDNVVRHIVDAFGTEEAIEIAKQRGDRIQALRTLYQRQLEGQAVFVRYFEMRDRNNRVQYYLFFASNDATGHLKMKEAMWKVGQEGEFRFSDGTNPNQIVMFEADTTSPLIALLRDNFRNKGVVSGKEVRQFVEDNTAYLKKHMTSALKQEEAAKGIVVEAEKSDGKKRRRNTYPDESLLKFV